MDDDVLLADVLALLSSPSTTPSLPCLHCPSQPPKKPYAIGSTARRKIAIDALRIEAQALQNHLMRLREQYALLPHSTMREHAATERQRRSRAEQECALLRTAVYQQTQFLRGLQTVCAVGPAIPLTLNLCHHLHTFTRLPRDRTIRQDEYNALTKDERLHAAMALLCRETERIAITDAYIDAEYECELDEACAVTTTSVFVLGDVDVPTVVQAASAAVNEIVIRCRAYQCLSLTGEVVDADTLSDRNLEYHITNVQRASIHDTEAFSVASRAVTMHRMLGDTGIVVWDFVDVDERYPLHDLSDLSRQSVGVSLVRRERCVDGVERTVLRELSTRRYEYRGQGTPSPSALRYLESLQFTMRSNELLFRDLLIEHMQKSDGPNSTPDLID